MNYIPGRNAGSAPIPKKKILILRFPKNIYHAVSACSSNQLCVIGVLKPK